MVSKFSVYLVNLDPTVGHEINKKRPCVVISPNEMNEYIGTVIVAPLTTKGTGYPTRVACTFQGKKGQVVLDQIRTIDKLRLLSYMGDISKDTQKRIQDVLIQMFDS